MSRYVIVKNNLFHDSYLNADEAQKYAMEAFGAKLINGQLCDKNDDRKPLNEIFEDNGFEFKPLKTFIEPHGILENEIANVHIEDGQLVITIKDGAQKRIIY